LETGTPGIGEIYGGHTATNDGRIVIYGPTGTKLCQSAITSIGESIQWWPLDFAGASCPELTESVTYTLLWVGEGFFDGQFATTGTWDLFKPAGTVDSPPASITPGTPDGGDQNAGHPMTIRIKCE
jgi:hypothetical protein